MNNELKDMVDYSIEGLSNDYKGISRDKNKDVYFGALQGKVIQNNFKIKSDLTFNYSNDKYSDYLLTIPKAKVMIYELGNTSVPIYEGIADTLTTLGANGNKMYAFEFIANNLEANDYIIKYELIDGAYKFSQTKSVILEDSLLNNGAIKEKLSTLDTYDSVSPDVNDAKFTYNGHQTIDNTIYNPKIIQASIEDKQTKTSYEYKLYKINDNEPKNTNCTLNTNKCSVVEENEENTKLDNILLDGPTKAGNYQLHVTAYDLSLNKAEASSYFSVDKSAPQLIDTKYNGEINNFEGNNNKVNPKSIVTTFDKAKTIKYSVDNDMSWITLNDTTKVVILNEDTTLPTLKQVDGIQKVLYEVEDQLNNKQSYEVEYIVDNTAPVIDAEHNKNILTYSIVDEIDNLRKLDTKCKVEIFNKKDLVNAYKTYNTCTGNIDTGNYPVGHYVVKVNASDNTDYKKDANIVNDQDVLANVAQEKVVNFTNNKNVAIDNWITLIDKDKNIFEHDLKMYEVLNTIDGYVLENENRRKEFSKLKIEGDNKVHMYHDSENLEGFNINLLDNTYKVTYQLPQELIDQGYLLFDSKKPNAAGQTKFEYVYDHTSEVKNNNIGKDLYISDVTIPQGKLSIDNKYNPTKLDNSFSDNDPNYKVMFKYEDNQDYQDLKDIDDVLKTKEGSYKLMYYAIDTFKNKSEVETIEYIVDKTNPTIDVKLNNRDGYLHNLSINVKDNLDSKLSCTTIIKDSKNKEIKKSSKCNETIDVSKYKPGTYSIIVNAQDESGNKAKQVVKTFKVLERSNGCDKVNKDKKGRVMMCTPKVDETLEVLFLWLNIVRN